MKVVIKQKMNIAHEIKIITNYIEKDNMN